MLILGILVLLLRLSSALFVEEFINAYFPKRTSWSLPNHISPKPKGFKPVPDLISSHGYPVEVHQVVTEDGYILEVHRIPHGRYRRNPDPSRVVLMAHSLLASSSVYVVGGPNNALAYSFADSGYDVWLLNARGNMYSMKHVKLTPDNIKFWKFSWHEMGVYDVPACIDYILHHTHQHQLDYVGLSMGTTMFYVMSSERPEYARKIRRFAAMAPAVYRVMLGTFAAPFIHPHINKIDRILYRLGIREFLPSSIDLNRLFASICNPNNILLYPSCNKIISLYSGPIDSCLNRRKLPFFLSYFPDTTSVGAFVHYHQIINTEVFQQYDFGTKANLRKYGRPVPPAYDLSRAVTPTAIFYSTADQVSVPSGVKRLAREIPNLQLFYRIPKKDFAHMTFAWAENGGRLFHNKMLQFLWEASPYERYTQGNYTYQNQIRRHYLK